MATSGVITRYALAWEAGDLDTVFASYAPDFVAHYGGTSSYAGTHHGKDRFLEVLLETTARSQRRLIGVDAVYDEGDHGALFVREAVTVDGVTHTVGRALRYRVADDLLAECWLYDQDQHLVDASWATGSRTA